MSASSLYRQVGVKKDYLSYWARGRSRKAMSPRYITIHSTQNWSRGADANRHSLALKKGALGRLSWHYTVDEDRAVQHLPTNEQGNHADFDGPGNRYSIGIEMCENAGNSRSDTVERTAKLAAWLMERYNLPVSRVVPHYKWPRKGKRPANKNCPHFLLNNGKPGAKWRAFQRKVESYHRQISVR
ncbi:MAG: N-acetylmuramoyl-L-alanine amidase family protein [Akkermansiaceae bacterium]